MSESPARTEDVVVQSAARGYLQRKASSFVGVDFASLTKDYSGMKKINSRLDPPDLSRPLDDEIETHYVSRKALPNGSVFEGEVDRKGYKHGRGAETTPEGFVRIGYFQKGAFVAGRMVTPEGDVYQGEFKNELPHGEGVLLKKDGCRVQGTFRNGVVNGLGKEVTPDGDVYRGQFSQGQREGQGKLKCQDGSWYEGQWHENQMHGEGTLQDDQDTIYEGEFRSGQLHGKVTMTYADGTVQKTRFRKGKIVSS